MGRRGGAERTVPTAAERRLLTAEGFRRIDAPSSPREEWIDVGGQSMAWHRAVELARRDRAERRRIEARERRRRARQKRAEGAAT